MKVVGTILIILALVLAIVPQFTDCLSQGRAITLANGNEIPMKCHWTRQAEIAIAIPLLIVGVLMVVNRRRQTLRILSILGFVLGLSAFLLPAYLIGVCASEDMICNMLMKPTLLLAGVLTMVASLAGLLYLRGADPEAIDAEAGE
jgi:uncharacterized membrane protein